MTTLVVRERTSERGGGELVDAFDAQALAIAATAATPIRAPYATAYRAFAAFLRARYGIGSREVIKVAAMAAWRDEADAAAHLLRRSTRRPT